MQITVVESDLYGASNSIVIRYDKDGIIQYINDFGLHFFGYTSEELISQNVMCLVPNGEAAENRGFSNLANEIIENPDAHEAVQNPNITKEGKIVWVAWTNKTLLNEQGNVKEILAIGNDITAYKEAQENLIREISARTKVEAKLADSELKYRALYENAPLSYQSLDEQGCFLDVNPAWLRTLGYEREEVIGKCYADFLHSDSKPHFEKSFPEFKKRGNVSDVQFKIMHKNGQSRDISFEGCIGYNLDGSFRQTYCVFKDITEKKQAEEENLSLTDQLHQSQKIESIGRLAGGVAHDYNNMLSVIIGNVELAKIKAERSDPIDDNLEQILEAANKSKDITRQLLAFARKQIIKPKVINVNDAVEGMLKMLRNLLGENIDLRWQPKGDVWPVKIDPSQLDQVLANLCINARDAITDIGKMTIETDTVHLDEGYCKDHMGFAPGNFVLLSISDNGCGMNKETLDNIFEPFYTTKKAGEGTGLGMAVVYGIVKQSGGFINAYSEPNQGTTFKIYIPRHEGEDVISQETAIIEIKKGQGETVLLVEDEIAIVTLTKAILEGLGYSVLACSSPVEALNLLQVYEGDIQLLVTDVVMPGMNGRQLSKQIRDIYPGIQTLYMSGYTANVIAHHGVLDDGINFIQKPFSRQDLSLRVREILDSNG